MAPTSWADRRLIRDKQIDEERWSAAQNLMQALADYKKIIKDHPAHSKEEHEAYKTLMRAEKRFKRAQALGEK